MTIPQDDTAQLRARIDALEEKGAERIREINSLHDELRRERARAADLEREIETYKHNAAVHPVDERPTGDVDGRAFDYVTETIGQVYDDAMAVAAGLLLRLDEAEAEADRLRAALRPLACEMDAAAPEEPARGMTDTVWGSSVRRWAHAIHELLDAPDSGAPAPTRAEVFAKCRELLSTLGDDPVALMHLSRIPPSDVKENPATPLYEAEPTRKADSGAPAPVRDETQWPPGWVHSSRRPNDRAPWEHGYAHRANFVHTLTEAWAQYDAEHGYAPGATRDETVWLQDLVTCMSDLSREEIEGWLHERLYQSERGATRDVREQPDDPLPGDTVDYVIQCTRVAWDEPHDFELTSMRHTNGRYRLRHLRPDAPQVPEAAAGGEQMAGRPVESRPAPSDGDTRPAAHPRAAEGLCFCGKPATHHVGAMSDGRMAVRCDEHAKLWSSATPLTPQDPPRMATTDFGVIPVEWVRDRIPDTPAGPPATAPEDQESEPKMWWRCHTCGDRTTSEAQPPVCSNCAAESEDEAPLPEGWSDNMHDVFPHEMERGGKLIRSFEGPNNVGVELWSDGNVVLGELPRYLSIPAAVLRALLGAPAPDPRKDCYECVMEFPCKKHGPDGTEARITELERRIERAVAIGLAADRRPLSGNSPDAVYKMLGELRGEVAP